MHSLWQDLHYGLRMLLKRPGFSLVAVLMLAIGISANTAIFSLVDAFFFRPLPVPGANRLVTVEGTRNGNWDWGFSYRAYEYFRDRNESFEALLAHYSTAPLNVVADGNSKEAQGAVVSGNYFSTLGIHPLLGRFFDAEDDAVPDRNRVAIISHSMWQNRFGGDPSILDKVIRVNGADFNVIGVAPAGFQGVETGYPNEMWIPTMMLRLGYRGCDGFNNFDCRPLTLIGRLAAGREISDAEAEITSLAISLGNDYPATRDRGVRLRPAIGVRSDDRKVLGYQMTLLMGVAGFLLLIACANVASLVVVQGTARRKEIAVRLCIGARRGRLIRQLMTENLLLALAGGALGLVLSLWAKDLLLVFFTRDAEGYEHLYDLSLSSRVLGFSIALSIFSGLLCGLLPAIQSTHQDLTRALKDDGRSQSSGRNQLRRALVVGQVALSLVMLVGAGLLVRSAARVREGANFDPTHVALLRLSPKLLEYPSQKAQTFTHEVVRRLQSLPGVESVSLAAGAGFAWLGQRSARARLPEQARDPDHEPKVEFQEIAPRFFETLKIPLTQGRDFEEKDAQDAPRVVIVNETLARRMWPEGSPLERIIVLDDVEFQVVGVCKDSRLRNSLEGPLPFVYLAYWQNAYRQQTDSRMVIRVAGEPRAMLPLLRREIALVDSNVPISEDLPMTSQVNGKYRPVLMTSSVLICSGLIALFLSMIGLYGVLAFSVTQRTREIGIRMALGARQQHVLLLVVAQGMSLAMIGVAIGLGASFALTRVMANLLYGVSAHDPLTFASITLLLTAVALLACYLPARRAARVDPMTALRCE